jgi:hypothetical protein
LIEALGYRPKGRGFDSRLYNFSIDLILPAALWSWVDPVYKRIEYQEYLVGGNGGRCVGLTTLPPSNAECL